MCVYLVPEFEAQSRAKLEVIISGILYGGSFLPDMVLADAASRCIALITSLNFISISMLLLGEINEGYNMFII